MAGDLETLLRDVAATGKLAGVTLFPAKDGWRANIKVKNNGGDGWRGDVSEDPAEAICKALNMAGLAPTKPDEPEDAFG